MTRFKEKKRIDAAIEHENKTELEWGLGYCQQRLAIAPLKSHQKHWKNLKTKIRGREQLMLILANIPF